MHVTNNTLLALRYFYQNAPRKAEEVIRALAGDATEDELSVGLTFEQQVKVGDIIPDGLISQKALKIYFETKRGESNNQQIENYIQAVRNDGGTDV